MIHDYTIQGAFSSSDSNKVNYRPQTNNYKLYGIA